MLSRLLNAHDHPFRFAFDKHHISITSEFSDGFDQSLPSICEVEVGLLVHQDDDYTQAGPVCGPLRGPRI